METISSGLVLTELEFLILWITMYKKNSGNDVVSAGWKRMPGSNLKAQKDKRAMQLAGHASQEQVFEFT
jgi:hypothetical protein